MLGVVIIVFGVAGVGKTTVGKALASALDWSFYDADQFHPVGNIQKMRDGVPLNDADRQPWLEKLRALIGDCIEAKESAVLACSALKERYRSYLKVTDEVKLVYLKADYTVIQERIRTRRGHFINPALLQSQFEILETPSAGGVVIDATDSPENIVKEIRKELQI
jgi:gluconokinase